MLLPLAAVALNVIVCASCLQALEDAHEGAIILLVSHGDTLSILEATMRGADTRQHRGYAFETAELRRLEA